jgi:hypothetical protein
VNKCGESCDQGDCAACQLELEVTKKKNQHRARLRLRKLQQQIEAERGTLKVTRLDKNQDAEYLAVFDRVTKYVLPMHNWYPQITLIEKVQNLDLEMKYEEFRAGAFGDHEDRKFHGTDDAGVQGITRNGFRIGKAGMYGAGIYFATDSSKSSQEIYTKKSNKLLLCKVFLGRAKIVTKADSSLTGKLLRSQGFDSVFAPRDTKASGGVLNDEFVVFDPRQAVVEYVIHYSTVSSSTAGLLGTNFGQPAVGVTGQAFRKVRMEPGRTINTDDPLEFIYRLAEGHFYRMCVKFKLLRSISAITIVVNPGLAASFAKKQAIFQKEKKGKVAITFYRVFLFQ